MSPASRNSRPGCVAPAAVVIPLKVNDPTLVRDLEALIEPTTRGDPQSPLRWTCKSTRNLAEALSRQGHRVSYQTVAVLLHELGYSLQALRKTREGGSHPDRDAQFRHINRQVVAFQERGQPVVSVDTKKKELVGDFKNAGREWQPEGTPEEARIYDFEDKRLGKVIPRGVYDLTWDEGWVSVGVDHDTAQFAAETLRRWWQEMGSQVYPGAEGLLITADSGGSNSRRSRLWKVAIQELGRPPGVPDLGVPLPAGDEQVEQDRAPDVLPPHAELAGAAPGESSGGGQLDRSDDDPDRIGGPCGT